MQLGPLEPLPEAAEQEAAKLRAAAASQKACLQSDVQPDVKPDVKPDIAPAAADGRPITGIGSRGCTSARGGKGAYKTQGKKLAELENKMNELAGVHTCTHTCTCTCTPILTRISTHIHTYRQAEVRSARGGRWRRPSKHSRSSPQAQARRGGSFFSGIFFGSIAPSEEAARPADEVRAVSPEPQATSGACAPAAERLRVHDALLQAGQCRGLLIEIRAECIRAECII